MIKKTIDFKPLIPSKAIANVYSRELSKLITDMVRDYRSLLTIYKDKRGQIVGDDAWLTTDVEQRFSRLGKKWQKRFEEYAKNKSPAFIRKILKQTDLQLKSTLKDYFAQEKFTLFGDVIPEPLRQVMKAHVAENVALITSIPLQYAERVKGAVYRAITGAGTLKDLTKELRKYGQMSLRRAKLIAGDQTRKAFTTLAVKRMEQVGISKYKWVHTGAGKTHREYHKRRWDGKSGLKDGQPNGLNGFIFDLQHLPVIDKKTGERGLPNQLPYCHCLMAPVITFEN